MGRYLLLTGIHEGADYSQEPKVFKDPNTGEEFKRYPTRTYREGEEVEHDTLDLVERFGTEKFAYLDRPARRDRRVITQPSVAPGGQVTTGYQVTVRLPNGQTVSRAMNEEEFERFFGGEEEEDKPQPRQRRESHSSRREHEALDLRRQRHSESESEEKQSIDDRYEGLDTMSKEDLKAVAEAEGVTLSGEETKRQILERLRSQ